MKRFVAALALCLMASPALGEWYYRGDANGWGNTLMTDNLDGTYSFTATGTPGGFAAWKFADTPGDWDWPLSGDSWGYYDGTGNLTITLDTNSAGDGWSNDSMRINVSHDGVGQWQAVGEFNGWNNSDAGAYMTPTGNPGVYQHQITVTTPGTYAWKAIETGSWNSIGNDSRSVNGDNASYTTTLPNEIVVLQVDALTGVVRAIPEPATLALLAVGGISMIRRRRR